MGRQLSVHELRQQGYKVRVGHKRYQYTGIGPAGCSLVFRKDYEVSESVYGMAAIPWQPLPKGGLTVVEITTPEGETLTGVAECSVKDQFNRKIGLNIALGRALNGTK